jgi:dTDP-4-dehydrorhamnose 3,5-epimerase
MTTSDPREPARLDTVYVADGRGVFAKPYALPNDWGIALDVQELFWSASGRGVVRGMHFQLPPHPLNKLVWVSRGSIVDVVVDLRSGPTFGAVTEYDLDAGSGASVWVPVGFAHGFQALEDDTIVNYAVDAPYLRDLDSGVRWNTLGYTWPLPAGPMSPRDEGFVALGDFDSPFGRP